MSIEEKEIKRILENPDSVIMSDGLEELIDLDFEEKEEVRIEINDKNFVVKILSMIREDNGISVSLEIPKFELNTFLSNADAMFNIGEEVYSCELVSVSKESGDTILSIFIVGI